MRRASLHPLMVSVLKPTVPPVTLAAVLIGLSCCCYTGAVSSRRPAAAREGPVVRVLLTGVGVDAQVSADAGLLVVCGPKRTSVGAGQVVEFGGGAVLRVKVGNRDWFRGRDTLECAASGGALIAVNERTYRGSILAFVSAGGGLVVVNELGLEEYLYGVVPCEIGPISEETFEAVKAQAVAARSFALARAGKRRGSGFDLYDSYARDQEYRGAGYETGPGREAVDATREEVLLFQGEPADALYHANCGGVTVGSSLPYLRSARDSPGHRSGARPYCAWSRSHTWQVQLPRDSVERALSRLVRVERLALCGLSLRKDPVTGRVVDVNVRTRKGTYRVSGADLRTALRLRSPTFDVRLRGRAVEFAGRGYGHGCGMCQDGAVGMARSGRSYRQILQHYYPRLRLGRRR